MSGIDQSLHPFACESPPRDASSVEPNGYRAAPPNRNERTVQHRIGNSAERECLPSSSPTAVGRSAAPLIGIDGVWKHGYVMAMVKVTFSLAPETVGMLSDAAERLSKPKSEVVRDAIEDYHARIDRLSETERTRMLAAFDEFSSKLSPRADEDVDREIEEVRASRRRGGRRTRGE